MIVLQAPSCSRLRAPPAAQAVPRLSSTSASPRHVGRRLAATTSAASSFDAASAILNSSPSSSSHSRLSHTPPAPTASSNGQGSHGTPQSESAPEPTACETTTATTTTTTTTRKTEGDDGAWRQQHEHQPRQRTAGVGVGGVPAAAAVSGGGGNCTRRTAALALAASAAVAATGTLTAGAAPAAAAAAASSSSAASGVSVGGSGDDAGGGAAARPRRRTWPTVPLVPLARGLRVSKVMRGCWQLSGRHKGDPLTDRTSASGEVVTDLAAFHQAGVTSLDLADNYGAAELMAGQYLRLYPHHSATTTIATKLSYLSEEEMSGASRTMVEYAVRRSLVRLGRERLDLVQLQWAEPVRHRRWLDTLKWLADLREEGLIGHLGVCNFAVPQLAAAVDSGVGLVSNQVQYSLIDRRPQLFMQKAAASYGIKLLAYGTVAGGLLADKYYGAPASKVRLDTASKQKYGQLVRQTGEWPGGGSGAAGGGGGGWLWMQEVLEAARTVGQRHGVSASAVATAWVLHQPQVAAAIVGARNARHIRDIQAACALQLDEVDLLDLDAVWEGVPNPPTSDVYVWERGGSW